jgi:methionyl aminopeptidase
MRKAGLLVWEALGIARQLVLPGATTASINAEIAKFFAEHNAQPLFLDYPNSETDAPAFPAVTCISINREVVHGIPSGRKLVEGDIVSIDTGCKLAGWCGDAAVTFPVGRVRPEVHRLLEVTKGVLQQAIDLVCKCQWWSEVAAVMEAQVKKHKFAMVEQFVGHGIGREMHEDPQVPNYVGRGYRRSPNDFRLTPGLVIAIEPMVNMVKGEVRMLGDKWTQVTIDGRPSAHFEHTVAVTEEGPCVLTAGPNGETW